MLKFGQLEEGFALLANGQFEAAARIGETLVGANPKVPDAWVLLCFALIRLGSADDVKALGWALTHIPKAHPAYILLAVEHARALSTRGQVGAAVIAARAIGDDPLLGPNALDPILHDILGHALINASLFDEALAHTTKAQAGAAENPGLIHNHANALRYLGKIDEALALYETLLEKIPQHSLAAFTYADSTKLNEISASYLLELAATALATPALPDADQRHWRYVQFKAHHDQKNHDAAFAALEAGSALVAANSPYPKKARESGLAANLALFGQNDHLGDSFTPNRPTPIFVLGLPRSGTTLVERILSQHSAVMALGETQGGPQALRHLANVPAQNPIDGDAMAAASKINWPDFAAHYWNNIGYLVDDAVAKGAAIPAYTTDKLPHNYQFVGALAKAFPDARFVHLRRGPMDSLFGAYRILFGAGSYLWSYDQNDLAHAYHAYRQETDHWRAILGGRWVDVRLDQLIDDSEAQIRRLLDGLGLAFEEACLAPEKAQGGVSTASSVQVRQKINRSGVDAWRAYSAHLEPLRAKLEALGYVDQDGNAIW